MPISVIVVARMDNETKDNSGEILVQENMAKLDKALAELESKIADTKINSPTPISIETVDYATASGKLVIEGKAPTADTNVMIATVVTPKSKTASESAKTNNVLGEAVELVAVKADNNGKFVFMKKIDAKKIEIVELKFEQGGSNTTITYDLEKRKRVM